MLELNPRIVDEILVLDCNGRMAFGENLSFFKNFLKQLLLTTDTLVVNLDQVTYLDSSGLSILVSSYTSARERGATMKLAAVNSTIHEIFRITKLLGVFDIHDTVDDAIRDFPCKAASA